MPERHLKQLIVEKDLTLSVIFSAVIQSGYSIGIYKLPFSDLIHVIIDDSANILKGEIELESLKGFVFAPFENSSVNPVIFIENKCHLIYQVENKSLKLLQNTNESFLEILFNKPALNNNNKWHIDNNPNYRDTISENFEKKVRVAIDEIKGGLIKKVVLSRTKIKKLTPGFSPVSFFQELCYVSSGSFVSLISTPFSGTWTGATPELLVGLDKEYIFKTVSLAGTRVKEKDSVLSQTLWTEKEIEEQALVSRYIINCFKKIRLREYEEIGPKTVEAGNLLHLKTEYNVNTKEVDFENLTSLMLHLLHPTSAVGGMPKDEALAIIRRLEENNRGYYSGYLGPVNMATKEDQNETEIRIFVNIRCMKLLQDQAVLYAGAGITEGSFPEKEFLETENKMDTILRVFEV